MRGLWAEVPDFRRASGGSEEAVVRWLCEGACRGCRLFSEPGCGEAAAQRPAGEAAAQRRKAAGNELPPHLVAIMEKASSKYGDPMLLATREGCDEAVEAAEAATTRSARAVG